MNWQLKNERGFEQLLSLVPSGPEWAINWDVIWALWPQFSVLDDCPQDAIYHAEGDVGIHTRMVVEALVGFDEWQALPDAQRSMLFWAACLHDIGKPAVTKHEENGRISSRGHSRVGASISRELLRDMGAPFGWREEICQIIMNHQLPFWMIERPDPARLARQTSWQCRADLLCMHARADALGRICEDQAKILESIELAKVVFEENGCFKTPFAFDNDESRVTYFEKDDRDPYYVAHEEFRCKVIVMAALPGSGKDTWIAQNFPDMPVVSLDVIRGELGVSPSDNQGKVIQAGRERAKEYLRAGVDFVWNATNVSKQVRSKPLSLLRDYGAHIHVVYIEVPPAQLFRQNKGREAVVPHKVIANLVQKLEPPHLLEAHEVSYVVGYMTDEMK